MRYGICQHSGCNTGQRSAGAHDRHPAALVCLQLDNPACASYLWPVGSDQSGAGFTGFRVSASLQVHVMWCVIAHDWCLKHDVVCLCMCACSLTTQPCCLSQAGQRSRPSCRVAQLSLAVCWTHGKMICWPANQSGRKAGETPNRTISGLAGKELCSWGLCRALGS
jgi:hypothetical protein